MFYSNLKEEIDVQDLQNALETAGPAFGQKVRDYLAQCTADLKRQQDQGVSPEEFAQIEKLKSCMEDADRIIQVFSKPR